MSYIMDIMYVKSITLVNYTLIIIKCRSYNYYLCKNMKTDQDLNVAIIKINFS
jgi:hypothetical protein